MTQTVQIEQMDELIDALGGGGGGGSSVVPTPEATDVGKVLTANNDGTASWDTIEAELPTVTNSDRGKALKVNKTNNNINWTDISEVPATTGASQGDVLTVGENGAEWATPSGGSDIPDYTTSDGGKVLAVRLTGPTTAVLEWQQKIYLPPSDSSMKGKHLKVGGSGNSVWAWEDTVLSTNDITTTEGTNEVIYTVTLPTLTVKSIYYGFDDRQIFYEDVIIPINTMVGIDNKTIKVNFANLPSGMKIEPMEVILNGYETTNYTMESKIDNINVDMGNFIITTKLKTSDMYGTSINFLVIKNINETQTV
jgi:hypothetical protein